MAPLADGEEDLAILEEIERMTSARQTIGLPIPGGLHPSELLTEAAGYGWTLVNAAFCYMRSTGNRFKGPERGAWYASYGDLAVEIAQAEVSWHLTQELEATGMRMLSWVRIRLLHIRPVRSWRGISLLPAATASSTLRLAKQTVNVWWPCGPISYRTSGKVRLGILSGRTHPLRQFTNANRQSKKAIGALMYFLEGLASWPMRPEAKDAHDRPHLSGPI